MSAKTLFDIPIASNIDPVTSHEAAADITASGVRVRNVQKIVRLVNSHPSRTSRELAATAMAVELGCDRYECARRLADAMHLHLVRQGTIRKCREGGKNAVVWLPVDGAASHDPDLEAGQA